MKVPGVLRHVFTVGSLTAVSRVLGLVREMLQSRLVGAGVEQSAFTLAFAIPNMARKLFGEGALTAAFVPVFKGELEQGNRERAQWLARSVMTCMLLILVMFSVLAVAAISVYLKCAEVSPRWAITLRLVRILVPYMVFICGAAFGMGVMNALGRFVEGAFMPAMLNVVWIATLAALCFMPGMPLETRVTVVAWAILAGGVAQMVFLFRCMAKRGFSPRLSFAGLGDEKVRMVWRNTLIAAVGAGAIQFNYMLDQVLAQLASPWAAGVIGYAERLMDLPLGIIGVAFGTVLLPTFAGCFSRNAVDEAREALVSSVGNLMFVMIPSAAGLFVLAPEITSVIYEGSAFDATATMRVSRAVAVYSLGLACFGFQKSLVPWFQAQNDMKTPLRVSLVTIAINASLNIAAVFCLPVEWRHVGLAASTVVCAAMSCVALAVLARRRNGALGLSALTGRVIVMLLGSAVMLTAIILLKPRLICFNSVVSLAMLVAAGFATYVIPVGLYLHYVRKV